MRALLVAVLAACGGGECPPEACDADGDGAVASAHGGDDCDDGDASIGPHALEVCGGIDDDCDGLVDDEDPSLDPLTTPTWYPDADGDGFGRTEDGVMTCSASATGVGAPGDCDDARDDVFPGADEACDAIGDNNCDGVVDPADADVDRDGVALCGGDCDDERPELSPLAPEICNGVDDDCDLLADMDDPNVNVWTCDFCPNWENWETAPVETTTYNPCFIDPAATWGCSADPSVPDLLHDGERLHRVALRTDSVYHRPQLLLWFPPGPGNRNTKVLTMAAYSGYRSILVGYPNEDLAWGLNCAEDLGDCYANGRQEILWGDDTSPYLDLSWPDSAIGRVVNLLLYLEAENPGEGWADYIAPAGDDLVWEDIVVMGWSEGGTNLGWLVHEREPYGAMLLSSPEDRLYNVDQDLASFYYTPFSTPGCALWSAHHTEEPNIPISLSHDAMGIPGAVELVENGAPPWGGTHRYTTMLTSFQQDDCTFHEAMAYDPCMSPDLGELYIYALCEIGNEDRVGVCPFTP